MFPQKPDPKRVLDTQSTKLCRTGLPCCFWGSSCLPLASHQSGCCQRTCSLCLQSLNLVPSVQGHGGHKRTWHSHNKLMGFLGYEQLAQNASKNNTTPGPKGTRWTRRTRQGAGQQDTAPGMHPPESCQSLAVLVAGRLNATGVSHRPLLNVSNLWVQWINGNPTTTSTRKLKN